MPQSDLTSKAPKSAESQFAIALRKIARQSAHIVSLYTDKDRVIAPGVMEAELKRYSELIGPWAENQSAKLLEILNSNSKRRFAGYSKKISQQMREDAYKSKIGAVARLLQAEQVELIKSIPIEAGQRAQKLAMEAVTDGSRASEVAAEIARTEHVTISRANLIARTETSKAASALTQARAESVESEGYIWRTGKDSDVRPSHKKMEGKFVRWDSPPTLDDMTGHAGEFPNCRCYAEVVIPER